MLRKIFLGEGERFYRGSQLENKSQEKIDIVYEGKYLRLLHKEGWEFVERNNCEGAVIIIGVTEEGKVLLVEQYRKPLGKKVIEFPAGLVNDLPGQRGEDWIEAAHREFLEETGYRAEKLQLLTKGPSSPGMSNEIIAQYLASGLKKVGKGGGDETESIRVYEIPLKEVSGWLRKKEAEGKLVDPKVFAGLYFIEQFRKGI